MLQKKFHHVVECEHRETARRYVKGINGPRTVVDVRDYTTDSKSVDVIIDQAIAVSGKENVKVVQRRHEVKPHYSNHPVYHTIIEETPVR